MAEEVRDEQRMALLIRSVSTTSFSMELWLCTHGSIQMTFRFTS
jgi:hypothetical protein